MQFCLGVKKIPEGKAVTLVVTDLAGSGRKPAMYKFPVPKCDIVFQAFSDVCGYPGDDLCQILIQGVLTHKDKYAPYAQDFWQCKGLNLEDWCSNMEITDQNPDEVALHFLSVFTNIHAAVLLSENDMWTTGDSQNIDDYGLIFLYAGKGVLQLTCQADDHTGDLLVPMDNRNVEDPTHDFNLHVY